MTKESKHPLILVTNDDGIQAPGIRCLVDCVSAHGDVIVVAPEEPQSGKSSAITVESPLRIRSHADIGGAKVYSVSGTPVDCVKLALHAIVPRKPDLLVSGINHGSNSGTAIIYSGTMGAVLEGCMVGIPSIGFSLLHHAIEADFSLSMPFVDSIVKHTLSLPLPPYICLNVNIPAKVVPEGVKVCMAARGHWIEEYKRYEDPSGRPFYMLTGHFENAEPDSTDTDEYWLGRQYISVVPVTPDQNAAAFVSDLAAIYEK